MSEEKDTITQMVAGPLKRPRVDNTDSSVPNDVQDEEIWMQDGNIIIAVIDEAKNERIMFKCHRGLLVYSLTALKEMFEADHSCGSTAVSVSEHYDGTPVVRLYDEVDHVRHVLRVLYKPRYVIKIWLQLR